MLFPGRKGRHRRRGTTATTKATGLAGGKANSPLFQLLRESRSSSNNSHRTQPSTTSRRPTGNGTGTSPTPAHAHADGPTIVRTAIELISVTAFLVMAPTLLVPRNTSSTSTSTAKEKHGMGGSSSNGNNANDGMAAVKSSSSPQQANLRRSSADYSSSNQQQDQQPKQHDQQHDQQPRSSILLLGLVKDLRDVIGGGGETESGGIGGKERRGGGGGGGVLASMEEVCKFYSHGREDTGGSSVGIWITYAQGGRSVDDIRKRLDQSGCSDIVLEREDEASNNSNKNGNNAKGFDGHEHLSRYERLAMLRSQQRRRVIDRLGSSRAASADDGRPRFDVVVNIDFDLLSLPNLGEFVSAVEAVASVEERGEADGKADADSDADRSHHSLVVCANGYETWFNREHGPKLYYDTLPAIDDKGRWYYQTYSRSPFRVATFGQSRLFNSIKTYAGDTSRSTLSNHPLWPMKACFGGVAMYGWHAFSSAQCDYVRSEISLPSQHGSEEGEHWRFPQKYTFSGAVDGDACEHAIFQLCLEEEFRQRRQQNNDDSSMVVGIQPGLIVSREANLMSTDDAMTALQRGIVIGLGLFLIGAKIVYDRRKKVKSILYKE